MIDSTALVCRVVARDKSDIKTGVIDKLTVSNATLRTRHNGQQCVA